GGGSGEGGRGWAGGGGWRRGGGGWTTSPRRRRRRAERFSARSETRRASSAQGRWAESTFRVEAATSPGKDYPAVLPTCPTLPEMPTESQHYAARPWHGD